ncbi:MAG: hypothetical protein MN733_36785, partial [Nitrososphaera sp.]|nr:hypothetical protein [Nitrososphaera sp.]
MMRKLNLVILIIATILMVKADSIAIAQTGSGVVVIPTVESDHPYPNNHDDFWLVPSIDAQADATRLFFSTLELENGVDWLILMDGQDTEIQRITGSYPEGLWSEPIPGNLAKVRLVTDTSVRHWGFAIDALESVSMPSLLYSSHPYPNNADLKWQLTNLDPDAEGTRLHFSRLELEENVDWLVIMDSTEAPFQWITGYHPEGLWTNSVPGNGVIVKLITDSSVNRWGFNIDTIESAPPDPALSRP